MERSAHGREPLKDGAPPMVELILVGARLEAPDSGIDACVMDAAKRWPIAASVRPASSWQSHMARARASDRFAAFLPRWVSVAGAT